MPHRSPLRAAAPPFVLVFLFSTLAALPANATPLGAGPPLLDRLWQFVVSIWSEAGCGIDTNGQCKEVPSTRPEGCALDPSGACASAPIPHGDRSEGCGLDPNGACASAPILREEGCGIDTNGGCGR